MSSTWRAGAFALKEQSAIQSVACDVRLGKQKCSKSQERHFTTNLMKFDHSESGTFPKNPISRDFNSNQALHSNVWNYNLTSGIHSASARCGHAMFCAPNWRIIATKRMGVSCKHMYPLCLTKKYTTQGNLKKTASLDTLLAAGPHWFLPHLSSPLISQGTSSHSYLHIKSA